MVQTNIQEYWQNDVNYCLQSGKLVYVNHPKCASTYYINLLKTNGWQPVEFKNIDWRSDQVFGFFMNPTTKHAKAITEDLVSKYADKLDDILNLGERFFQDIGLFGWHSMPLWLRFSHYVYNITWIPLDGKLNSDELFQQYLKHHDMNIKFVQTDAHQSIEKKQQVFQIVKQLIGNGSAIQWQMLAKDLDLYNYVMSKINYHANCWTEIYGYCPHKS
jgi:hypothetical protein